MASTLVIEDGTLVANADSYISLADARAYATKRGVSLAADDTAADVQLRRAFDFLESLRESYKGKKSDSAQLTQWPRKCVFVDDEELSSAVIPVGIQYAQVQYAAAINSGIDIAPVYDGSPFIKSEKVGPLETVYSDVVSTTGTPAVRTAEALLAPLMKTTGYLQVERA